MSQRPPPQSPYPGPSQLPPSSPYTGPQSNQRGLWAWYKRQGRGGKIGLVCGLLVAVLLLGYGLTGALGSMHASTPSPSSASIGQKATASPTPSPLLAPTSIQTHKLKPSTTVITIGHADYSPATLTIAVGSTVIWKNRGPVAHTVTSDDGKFDSGDLPAGGTFRFTFSKSGTFPYVCEYHPYMIGTIIVQ